MYGHPEVDKSIKQSVIMYPADSHNYAIRKISSTGDVIIFAGFSCTKKVPAKMTALAMQMSCRRY